MPGIVLHRLLATQILNAWRGWEADPPFALDDPAAEAAFHHGALGPDIGYYPGSARAISELAHASRSADMARALLHCARTPLQKAYAWGWVTHVLADVAVHPLIDRAAAAAGQGADHGDSRGRAHMVRHLRVEVGLDAYIYARFGDQRVPGFGFKFPAQELRFVATAYRLTYGSAVSVRDLGQAQIALSRLAPTMVLLTRAVAGLQRLSRLSPRVSSALRPRGASPAGGFATIFAPAPPPGWLVRAVRRIIGGFALVFHEHYVSGLRDLANHSLTSGALDRSTSELLDPTDSRPRYSTVTSRAALSAVAGATRA